MTPSEIIKQDASRQGYDADIVLRKMAKAIESGGALLLQENDSVLVLLALPGGAAEAVLFTADSPLNFKDSLGKFLAKIRSSDIAKIYGKTESSEMTQALQSLGIKIQQSDNPKFEWMISSDQGLGNI
jgi:hypothetical protein